MAHPWLCSWSHLPFPTSWSIGCLYPQGLPHSNSAHPKFTSLLFPKHTRHAPSTLLAPLPYALSWECSLSRTALGPLPLSLSSGLCGKATVSTEPTWTSGLTLWPPFKVETLIFQASSPTLLVFFFFHSPCHHCVIYFMAYCLLLISCLPLPTKIEVPWSTRNFVLSMDLPQAPSRCSINIF